ncbi:TonB-dependent receptor [Sandarakinorhabdus sp. DWP1-3-1]|uniref:TonB-dependent receptor n=1 Tax=Sandarakinorhabdus sp. DWP1-3-1 TaxID=2804627 RepID=UPI003CE6B6CF
MIKSQLLSTIAIASLAFVTPALAEGQSAEAQISANEIVVTAQRRTQTLAEVPQSISVVSGEALERQRATSFLDFAALVPGFTVTQTNPGESRLILRGVNTGSVGSTVAVYVDDIPFGSSGSLANGGVLAGDFDTFDIARVEVLRGPQGTLYGSNALGGVLKYVTALPDFGGVEVRGQAGVEDTRGAGIGYLANAMVNVPLGDKLAFRASGFYRKNKGVVDAIGLAGEGVDDNASYGGRASLLLKASDRLSIRLSALLQNIEVDSPSSFTVDPLTLKPVNPITGGSTGGQRQRYQRYPETNNIDYRLYSGTIDWDLDFASLTSVTSYATQDQVQINDFSTQAARGTAQAVYGPGATNTVGLAFQSDVAVEKFTQEVRLASADSETFEWLIGAYYTREKTGLFQRFLPFNFASGALIPRAGTFGPFTFNEFVVATIDANYEEIAGFGSATLHLGDRFEITAGGRYSHNKQDSVQAIVQLGNGDPQLGDSSQGVFTWSVAPRFELSEHASVYARVAKGFRPGGPNFVPLGAPANFPTAFNADTLISYEAGVRAETADGTFSLDASVYHIDWSDILILTTVQTPVGPVGVNGNGKRARTSGVEATATLRPIRGLSFVVNGAYTDAKLLDDTVSGGGMNLTGGIAGDQLPYTPKWSANISSDYEWSIGNDAVAYVGANIRMMGDQTAGFNAAYTAAFNRRINIDSYSVVDLRAGVNIGRVSLAVYARNVTDAYGVVAAGDYPFAVPPALGGAGIPLLTASTIRPRTIGGTVGFRF